MGNQHVIELNGKRYDTLTGKIITAKPLAHAAKGKQVKAPRAVSIDGFYRKKSLSAATTKRQPNQAAAHKAEKSKTLMRTTVAKPKPIPSSQIATKKPTITHNTSTLDQQRLAHAKSVPKSPAISRFSSVSESIMSKARPKAQTDKPSSTHKGRPTTTATTVSAATTHAGLVDKALARVKAPDASPLKQDKRTDRIARKLHLKPRHVSIGGFAIALLLVVGFFAYQNATNISMRIASSRAGIHGSLPSYQPAGFTVTGGIAYNPGQITISYKATTDNRNFKIMQNVSDWNSQALLDNFVATNHPNNQMVQDRGKTIYIYDGSNATWVDGGIWYRIEGESQLNSDQLLNIAASL